MHKLITKWQSLYVQKQIRDQTLEQYTMSYITDKLVPMWPDGWIKSNDIQSHVMAKTKTKEPKKPTTDTKAAKLASPMITPPMNSPATVIKPSENIKNSPMMGYTMDKKKSQVSKDPMKLAKTSGDKPSHQKTDKKHLAPDRPAASSMMSSMPTINPYNAHSVRSSFQSTHKRLVEIDSANLTFCSQVCSGRDIA